MKKKRGRKRKLNFTSIALILFTVFVVIVADNVVEAAQHSTILTRIATNLCIDGLWYHACNLCSNVWSGICNFFS